jgi:hypothetical protein
MLSTPVSQLLRNGAFVMAGMLPAAAAFGNGRFLAPHRGQALSAGSSVEVRWAAPCGQLDDEAEREVLLSLDGGLTFTVRVTPEMSACAAGFRWVVPALPAAHARLALRAGSGESSDDERIEVVSDDFTIVSSAQEAPVLLPGSREWWTVQAVTGEGVDEFPLEAVAGSPERIVAPSDSTDISEPPAPSLEAPVPSRTAFLDDTPLPESAAARRVAPGPPTILPLRL